MVAGSVTVTPASGYIGVPGGLIGLVGGVVLHRADLLAGRIKLMTALMYSVYSVSAGFSVPLWCHFLQWINSLAQDLPKGLPCTHNY